MQISSINNLTLQVAVPVETATPGPITQDQRALIQAVKAINAGELFGPDNEVTLILDRATRRVVARIVNRQSGEVVDQIPAEYVLRMAEQVKSA